MSFVKGMAVGGEDGFTFDHLTLDILSVLASHDLIYVMYVTLAYAAYVNTQAPRMRTGAR